MKSGGKQKEADMIEKCQQNALSGLVQIASVFHMMIKFVFESFFPEIFILCLNF